jgi:ParB/RepB/Spo0J family partition protein
MKEITIPFIPLGKIRPSKTNPRKHFDEGYIAELADSIRQKGIIQPLTVRPDWCIGKSDQQISNLNGDADRKDAEFFEIVAGECRYRGAQKADLAEAPAIVRRIGDKETLEIQLIENLQRSDLTPLEEAQGYRRLIDEMGYTVELIHDKTGKDRKTIYGKLKMLLAPKILLDALEKEVIGERICELVGRIPFPEMRDRAAREILNPKYVVETEGDWDVVKDQPMSYRRASDHVRDNYMRSLSAAQFNQSNPSLVEIIQDDDTGERIGGGSCDDCPMKSGNRPELFGDLKRPDVCTNPKCFSRKTDAHFVQLQKDAEAHGKKLLTEKETAQIFENDGSMFYDSPYVRLTDRPDARECPGAEPGGKLPTWGKLLELLESKPMVAIARDPKNKIVELVDRNLAVEAVKMAAKQKGGLSIFDEKPRAGSRSVGTSDSGGRSGEPEPEWKKQERKNRDISKFNFAVTLAGIAALIDAIDRDGPVKGFWDALIEVSIEHAGHDGCWLICKRLGLDPKAENGHTNIEGVQGAALEYGLTLPDDKLKLGFLVELLLSKRAKIYNSGSMGGLKSIDEFKRFAKLYKIELSDVERQVRETAKEKAKVKANVVISGNPPDAGKSKLKKTIKVPHKFEKIADNKYRCECGAFAVKQKGKFILAKEFRDKPCSRKLEKSKKSKPKKVKAKSKRKAVRK